MLRTALFAALSCHACGVASTPHRTAAVYRAGDVGEQQFTLEAEHPDDIQLANIVKSQIGSSETAEGNPDTTLMATFRIRMRNGTPLLGFLPMTRGERFDEVTLAVPAKMQHQFALYDLQENTHPGYIIEKITIDRKSKKGEEASKLTYLHSVEYRQATWSEKRKSKRYVFK